MATKHYVITKEMIDSSLSETSENPVQNKVIKTAVDAKLNKTYTAEDKGKVPRVGSDGVLALSALPEGKQADWNQESTEEADFIKNRPFKKIGTGLTVDSDGNLSADTQLHYEKFSTLPAPSATYKNTIALVKKTTTETGNIYDEFACVEAGTDWEWERIGDMKGTVEQSEKAITVNGTDLQTASDKQVGLLSSGDYADMQRKSNLVTAFQTTTEDTKYPSEKLVKTSLDEKVSISGTTVLKIGKDETGIFIEE